MFGAVVLLIMSGIRDIEEVVHAIEWATVLFFAGLFVLIKVSVPKGNRVLIINMY